MAILRIIQGPDLGKRLDLPDNEPQLLGRSSEALNLNDQTCSRRHAELTPDDGLWYVRDLGSANGTYLNGHRIGTKRARLHQGDQIRVGSTVMVFGSGRYGGRHNPVLALDDDEMDAVVEHSVDASGDSMILAIPNPSTAAEDHLRIIYELTRITTQYMDRNTLLEFVMDLIFEEFKPERGFIVLQETPDGPSETAVVRYEIQPRNVDQKDIHISRTIVSHVLSTNQGVLSSNAMKDQRFASGDSVRNYAIRSAICVPILHHEKCYGVIHIDSSVANYTFTDSQLRLLTAIGQHVGLALSNVSLYELQLQSARLAAVGETVASLSHSIKNILQGLRGGADVVGRALRKKDLTLAQGGWDILSRNLDRIYALSMNMLTFSKQRQVEIELTKLGPLLQDIIALVQPQCDRRGTALLTDFDPDMPPIPMDPNMIHQALVNLVMNAIEAVEPETGIITLQCDYDPVRDSVRINISDNGPGIAPGDERRVWLPFHSTKGTRGTGLGLAVTRKIVEDHGGRIAFESDPDQGTTFTIELSTNAERISDPSETVTASIDSIRPSASTDQLTSGESAQAGMPMSSGQDNAPEQASSEDASVGPRTPFDD